MIALRTMAAWAAFAVAVALFPTYGRGQSSPFERIATLHGKGIVDASIVGMGPTTQSRRYYRVYEYAGDTFELLSIDPDSGAYTVFANPIRGEYGGQATAGSDGNIYIGTHPHAHLLRFDPRTSTFTDLGRPEPSETFIWGLTTGADGAIYGATYPSAKLFRYSPQSARTDDLGRMSDTEQYARTIVSSGDYVYVGIGFQHAQIVAYNIRTHAKENLLTPEQAIRGVAILHKDASGTVNATVGTNLYEVRGTSAVLRNSRAPAAPFVTEYIPEAVRVRTEATYLGRAIDVFRLAVDTNGAVYASSLLPAYLFRVAGSGENKDLGYIGSGEAYSMVFIRGLLYMALYHGAVDAPLMVYDPDQPYLGRGLNPRLIHFAGAEGDWRPQATAVDGSVVYVGAAPGYGELGGPLIRWDTLSGEIERFPHIAPNQAIETLALADGMLVGGTNISGGLGISATEHAAEIFVWNPSSQQTVYHKEIAGAGGVADLVTASNGMVFAIAGNNLLEFDPKRFEVTHSEPLGFGGIVLNSVANGPDGNLWGIARSGIFKIDVASGHIQFMQLAPHPITAGFAIVGNELYYGSGPDIWRYRIP